MLQLNTMRFVSSLCLLGTGLLLLLCTLTFQGCGIPHAPAPKASLSAAASAHGVFRLNLGTEPPNLDPMKATDLTSFTVLQNIMRGLTRFGPHGEILPAVAQRWTTSADGKTLTFYLNPQARWQDGRPVVAQHFADAWQRVLTPENASDYAFFLFDIVNAKAYYEHRLKNFGQKDFDQVGIRVLNPQTLQVRLAHPVPFFLALMASPVALPVRLDVIRPHVLRQSKTPFAEADTVLSNGPYVLAQWTHEDHIRLKPNPAFDTHAAERPDIDMLMVNDANTSVVLYENNALDFIETTTSIPAFDVRRLRQHPDAQQMPVYRLNYIGFNTQKPPFNNPKVRQAFAMAVDKTWLPKLLKSGQTPYNSWIPKGLLGYNPQIGLAFNPTKAQKLLAQAGYPNGKGFPTVELAYRSQYDIQKEAEILQFLWQKHLHVQVRLVNLDWKVLLSRLGSDPPHLFRQGWFADYPDPDTFMNVFLSTSGNNSTGWKNPVYDALLARAIQAQSTTERQGLYNQAQRLLLEEDAVMMPLYLSQKTWLVKPWVKGLQINALNLIDLEHVRVGSR